MPLAPVYPLSSHGAALAPGAHPGYRGFPGGGSGRLPPPVLAAALGRAEWGVMDSSELLRALHAGRVLDVGTGKGQFVGSLIEELGSYTEMVGIDLSDEGAAAFEEAFGHLPSVSFLVADATAMPFADESFDTVAIAGSLHHLADPKLALSEMRRVLRSGGTFIVYEQFRDHQTRAELTHVRFHHWSEEILGVAPRPTYRRAELLDLVRSLHLAGLQVLYDRDRSDPRDPIRIARFDAFVDDYLQRAAGQPRLVARGRRIRARLHDVGIAFAGALFALGVKP